MWVATIWVTRNKMEPLDAVTKALKMMRNGAEMSIKDKGRHMDVKSAKKIIADLEGQTPEMLMEKYGEAARKEVDDHDKAIKKIIAKGKKPRLRRFESMVMKRMRLKALLRQRRAVAQGRERDAQEKAKK